MKGISKALEMLVNKEDLPPEVAMDVMEYIAQGKADPVQTGAFLVLLAAKGETIEEIKALVKVMRKHAAKVHIPGSKLLDIVGTGGDGHNTVNISTSAAIVCAACGARVAKHGSKGVSSKSGSSDVLGKLGIALLGPESIERCVDKAGIAFMFAPKFHPAMKHVVEVRKALGVKTVFNILGPLLNPAGASRLMLGVYSPELLETYGKVLHGLGVEHALVVHCCGMDELSAVGVADAVEVTPETGVVSITIDPNAMGIEACTKEDLIGGEPEENAETIRDLFQGGEYESNRMKGLANTIALNAGAGLYVYGLAATIKEGYDTAIAMLKSGKVKQKLEEFAKISTELHQNEEPEVKKLKR